MKQDPKSAEVVCSSSPETEADKTVKLKPREMQRDAERRAYLPTAQTHTHRSVALLLRSTTLHSPTSLHDSRRGKRSGSQGKWSKQSSQKAGRALAGSHCSSAISHPLPPPLPRLSLISPSLSSGAPPSLHLCHPLTLHHKVSQTQSVSAPAASYWLLSSSL